MMQKTWTEKEVDILIRNYPNKGKSWCMKRLGRIESSIRYKAFKLNLKQNEKSRFFREWQMRARTSKFGVKRPEHSEKMKLLYKQGRLPAISDPRTKEQRSRLAEYARQRIQENGHPKGMLGKKHSQATKMRLAEISTNMWKDPSSKVNSPQNKQRMSDLMVVKKRNGFGRFAYSRGRMGTYIINNKAIFFRSLWEANYALYLDFLIDQHNIDKWEYESQTFWFEKIKRGVRSYKPDFKVYIGENVEFHEVKGWMDPKSKTKLKRMKKYYPQVSMVLVNLVQYKNIIARFKNLINFYS